jgi:hypothetical protein
MSNGTAVALAFEPVASPASIEAPTSAASQEIAEAVASATGFFAIGLLEYQDGGRLCPETRVAIGERVGRVAMLQLDHEAGDADFAIQARGAAPLIRQAFDENYLQRYTPQQVDRKVDFFLNELLAIVDRVVASERIFRTN